MADKNHDNSGSWFQLLLITVATIGISLAMLQWLDEGIQSPEEQTLQYERIVSLTPAMTSTFLEMGAGAKLVGVSDYCEKTPELESATRVGTGLTPNYEGIVRLRPDLIVLETTKQGDYKKLEAIAETRVLPWLTLDEVVSSTQTLGAVTGRKAKTNELGRRLVSGLSPEEPLTGPRVLLLMGLSNFDGGSLWFIKRNSLHGAAMHAAGARNAIAEDVSGAPSISMEELLKIDPDIIVSLVAQPELSDEDKAIYLKRISKLGILKAVQSNKVGFVVGKQLMGTGPEILTLVDALKAELQRLSGDS